MTRPLFLLIALALVGSAAPLDNALRRWAAQDRETYPAPKQLHRFLRATGTAPVGAAVAEGEKVAKLGPRLKRAVGRWKAKFKEWSSPVATYRWYKKRFKIASKVLGWYVAVKLKILEFIEWIRETLHLAAGKKKSRLSKKRKKSGK